MYQKRLRQGEIVEAVEGNYNSCGEAKRSTLLKDTHNV